MIVPGGFRSNGTLFDDVQSLNLATNTWTTDTANRTPPIKALGVH